MNGEVVTIDPNTNCTACFRAYGDVRGRVPRMLPCYHTCCERCVWKHTRWNSVRCPQCETKHPAQHGPEAFPVNLQVLEYIGRMIQSGYQMVEPPPGTHPVTPKSAAKATDDVFWTDEIDYDQPPKLAAQKIREAILDKPWIPQTAFQKNPGKGNSSKKGNVQKAAADDGVIASSTPITPQRKPQAMEPRGQLQTSKISPVSPVKMHPPNQFSPDQLPQIRILGDDRDEEARHQHQEPEEEHREVYQDLDERVMSRYPNTHHNHESDGVPESTGSWNNQINHKHGMHEQQHQTRDVNNGPQQRGLRTEVPPNQVQNRGKNTDIASNSRQIRNNGPPNQNGYDHDHQFYQQRQHPDVLQERTAMRRSLERDFNRQSPGVVETHRSQLPIDLNADDWFKKRLNEDMAAGTIPRVTVLPDPDHSVNEDINLGHRNHMDHQDLGRQDHNNHHDGRRNNIPEAPKPNLPKTLVSPSDNKENIPRGPPVVPITNQHTGNEVRRRLAKSGQENIPSTNTRPSAQNQNVAPTVPKEISQTVETNPMAPKNKTFINLMNQSGEVTVIRPPRFLDHEKREPPKVQWGHSKQERNIKTSKPPLPTERPVHNAQVPTKVPVPAQRQSLTTKPLEVRKVKSEELLRRPKKVKSREAREMGDNSQTMEDFFMENLLKDATSGVERDGVVWSDRVGVIRKPKKRKGKGRSPDMHDGNLSQGSKREIPQRKEEVPREIAWKGPACRFKCRVVRSIELKYNRVWHLCVMSDDSAVVCGERYGWCRLTHYSLRDGERLGRLRMEEANGLTEIEHNGRIYLAIAYSKDRVIELYDVRDLRKTAHTYHVEPDRPGIMCTSSPYTLLYADSSKYVKPQDVTSLDCRTSRPVYKGTTHTRYPSNSDMCCVRDGDKSLLVTSYSHQGDEESGIYAYNRRTDTLEWSIKGYLRGMEKRMSPNGVTTDGRGHLFVCDQQNACVQMFSTDGVYMGTVLRTRENGMFEPSLVRWSDRMSALIIVHQNREETWISVVNVQPSG